MIRPSLKRALVLPTIGLVLAGSMLTLRHTNAEPASMPATSPTTQPASQPSAEKKDETVVVAKGSIDLRLDLDGVFAPVDAFEARIRTKAYQGDFTIVSAVGSGEKVKKGDVVLEIDSKLLRRQIAQAENELANARANTEKAEADAGLGAVSDELAMKQTKDSFKRAEDGLKWWDDNDSKGMLAMVDINDKMSSFQVESSEDELAQLKKMYKSEDLTNETADIVMKRALRINDIYKKMQEATGYDIHKTRDYFFKIMREQLAMHVDQSKQSVVQLAAAQKQQQVTRKTGVDTARIAQDTAADKLADLRKDLDALKLTSEIDGTAIYGTFRNKAWQAIPVEQMRVGEKVQAQQVLITVCAPSKLKVIADLAESKLSWVPLKTKVRVVPAALNETTYEGTVDSIELVGAVKGAEQSFDLTIGLPDVDARLAPGFKAAVTVPGGKSEEVLVVPTSAVSKGRVWVKVQDKDEPRDVVVGRSDSTNVEIKSGLNEGEVILKQAKK